MEAGRIWIEVIRGHEDIVDFLLKNESELDIDPEFFSVSFCRLTSRPNNEDMKALLRKDHDCYYDKRESFIDIRASNKMNPDHAQTTERRQANYFTQLEITF